MSSLTGSPSCLPLSHARNGCAEGAERVSLLFHSSELAGWLLGKKCVPCLSMQTVLILLSGFSQKELVGFVLFMQGAGRGLVCNSQVFPGIPLLLPPPLLTPGLCHCHSRPPSCSYLHFLGRTLSSFGLKLADLALTVLRTNGRWRRLKDMVLSGIL